MATRRDVIGGEIASWINQLKTIHYILLALGIIGFIIAVFAGVDYVAITYGITYITLILVTIYGLVALSRRRENPRREDLFAVQHAALVVISLGLSVLLLIQSPLYWYTTPFALANIVFAVVMLIIGIFIAYRNVTKYGVPSAP